MTKSLPYLMEDPKRPYKPKENYPQKAKGMSFFAFIFSIFVYISIFYIFNLSPTLFKTYKFWFLISNTLILILAADYGAFSSSKNRQQDVYDEYFAHSEARRVNPSSTPFTSGYQDIVKNSHILHDHHQQQQHQQESIEKDMQEEKETKESTKTPERRLLQIVAKEAQKEDIQEKRIVHVDHKRGFETKKSDAQPITYRRSKSEKDKRVVIDETKNSVILKRSETNTHQQNDKHVEEMNEFATMSDEDLNRRVEEFIQRFNRQIRLQALGDNYN